MTDSGRAVVDSGRVVLLDMLEKWFVINQNILVMLQSDETIWAKLLESAAGCIEECIDATQFNAHRLTLY